MRLEELMDKWEEIIVFLEENDPLGRVPSFLLRMCRIAHVRRWSSSDVLNIEVPDDLYHHFVSFCFHCHCPVEMLISSIVHRLYGISILPVFVPAFLVALENKVLTETPRSPQIRCFQSKQCPTEESSAMPHFR